MILGSEGVNPEMCDIHIAHTPPPQNAPTRSLCLSFSLS